jgi:hypothetical protein
MKKLGLFTFAAALVALLGATHVVMAQAEPGLGNFVVNGTASGPFTFTLDTTTNYFTFSDTNVVFFPDGAINPGPVAITGNGYMNPSDDSIVTATVNFGSNLTLDVNSQTAFLVPFGAATGPHPASQGYAWLYATYGNIINDTYELQLSGAGAYSYHINNLGDTIETVVSNDVAGYWVPAPETGSVVAFGAMLGAGGLLLFARKRRSSAAIA